MNIIIYPGSENLNVNERMFATPLFDHNFTFIKDHDILSLQDKFKEKVNEIKTIIILLDNYGTFIEKNLGFIISNKTINFYIHENDIHYLPSKPGAEKRYKSLRDKLIVNNHVFILAYYWHHYKKIYNIHPNNVICFPKFVLDRNILQINPNPKMKPVMTPKMKQKK